MNRTFIIRYCLIIPLLFNAFSWAEKGGKGKVDLAPLMAESPPLYDLSKLKNGQILSGVTVFDSKIGPELVQAKVLGIMTNKFGKGRHVIIAEMLGDRFSNSQVVAGMSGSPFYVGNKLVGALGYGYGSFNTRAIAGIVPIKDMLEIENPKAIPAVLNRPLIGSELKALEVPLSLQGVPDEVLHYFKTELEAAGHFPVMGSLASLGAKKKHPTKLFAGGPLAIAMVQGDINMASIGTVSYVKGNRFLAFAHPMMGTGKSEMPVLNAEIVTTLYSSYRATKMGQALGEVGVLTDDRSSGIGGSLDRKAPVIPFDIVWGKQKFNLKISQHPTMVPMFMAMSTASLLHRSLKRELGGTYGFKLEVEMDSGDKAEIVRQITGEGEPLEILLARTMGQELSLLSEKRFHDVRIKRVKVKILKSNKVQAAVIESLKPGSGFFPGKKTRLQLRLTPYQKDLVSKKIELKIPYGLKPGKYAMTALAKPSFLPFVRRTGLWEIPDTYPSYVVMLQKRPSDFEACFFLESQDTSRRILGSPSADMVLSLKSLARESLVSGSDKELKKVYELGCVDTGYVLAGSVTGDVTVVEEKRL